MADEMREHLVERALYSRALLLALLLGSAVLLLGVSIFAPDLCVGAISALLAPLVAAAALCIGLLPRGFAALDARLTRFARYAGVFVRCAAVLCLVSGCAVALRHLAIARSISLSAVSLSNIRGLSQGIGVYCNDYGDYPAALADLLDDGWTTPKQLLCPFDAAADERNVTRNGYSSYVYSPGRGPCLKDHAIILLHERLPWSYGRATWCCPAGYGVGFADGSVRWVSVDDMSEALSRDAARRTELGWPVTLPLGRLPAKPTTSAPSAPDH